MRLRRIQGPFGPAFATDMVYYGDISIPHLLDSVHHEILRSENMRGYMPRDIVPVIVVVENRQIMPSDRVNSSPIYDGGMSKSVLPPSKDKELDTNNNNLLLLI